MMTRREEMIRLVCAFIASGESYQSAVSLAGFSIDMVDQVEEERAEEADLQEEETIRLKEEMRARRRQCSYCCGEGMESIGYAYEKRRCMQCGGKGYVPGEEEE